MSIDLGDAPVGTPPTEAEKAQIREALGAGAPFTLNDVADNAAKLALTGIVPGYLVKITGEADRIEQYIGGDITQQSSWRLIGTNTFILRVNVTHFFDTLTVNGATITTTGLYNVGWVREDEGFVFQTPVGSEVSGFDLNRWSEVEVEGYANTFASVELPDFLYSGRPGNKVKISVVPKLPYRATAEMRVGTYIVI